MLTTVGLWERLDSPSKGVFFPSVRPALASLKQFGALQMFFSQLRLIRFLICHAEVIVIRSVIRILL